MLPRTAFLARLIGLYCIIVSLAMFVHRQATVEMVTAMSHDGPVMYLSGVIAVVSGLAIVLCHNVWSGGARPVIVTLIGWVALAKGILLVFVPPDAAPAVYPGALRYGQLFYLYAGFSLLLGLFLTYDAHPSRKRTD